MVTFGLTAYLGNGLSFFCNGPSAKIISVDSCFPHRISIVEFFKIAGRIQRSTIIGATVMLGLIGLMGCRSSSIYISPNANIFPDIRVSDSSELSHEIFLLGDGGAARADSPTLNLLKGLVERASDQSSVIFLGDNVYCCGLPAEDHPDRADAERVLDWQLDAVRGHEGQSYFLPGNHDWQHGPDGLMRQEAYLENEGGNSVSFLPNRLKPGPKVVKLTDDLVLVVIDSEWYLRAASRGFDSSAGSEESRADFLFELEQELVKHRDKTVVVVGHHPLFDNGKHGGHISLAQQMTPVPVLGSFRAFKRRFFGGKEDLSSREYTEFREAMIELFTGRERLIYAAGHSHSLQYRPLTTRRRTWHHLVSGSASLVDDVVRGRGTEFAASASGLIRLRFYEDQSIVMDILESSGEVLFSRQLEAPNEDLRILVRDIGQDGTADEGGYANSTFMAAANASYKTNSRFIRKIAGQHNRAVWTEPVTLPVLDVASMYGGLVPLQMGGGSQTVTIRLLSKQNDNVYLLRSVDKVSARIWSPNLQQTFTRDLLQDQTSMLHPFGALLATPLAEATGVYHTKPELVFVPDDPLLGPYRGPLVGRIALLEIRPNGDLSEYDNFGNAPDVDSYHSVVESITEDNDHRVDQWRWARSRLLDMLIADTDRTADNWRFAAVEPADSAGKIYEAVPRDRDAAFRRLDDIFPSLYKIFFQDLWQEFSDGFGNLRGLNRKGLASDRRFTSALRRSDWVAIADSMQAELSDEILNHVLDSVPPEIAEVEGEAFISTLTKRRNDLHDVAGRYYDLISRIVDVVGSDKHERFEVERMQDSTRIRVFSTKKDGETRRLIFERTVLHRETKEIRLYGLDGNDRFEVSGGSEHPILIRIVGGPGTDVLQDESTNRDRGHSITYHDAEAGNEIHAGNATKQILNNTPGNNKYDPEEVTFGRKTPITFFGSNNDDGFFFGGGLLISRDGFRRTPFGQQHRIQANMALRTRAFNFEYAGAYTAFIRKWDLKTALSVQTPNNIRNFYGLSNESKNDVGSRRFYQAKLAHAHATVLFENEIRDGLALIGGLHASFTDVGEDSNRFLAIQPGISSSAYEDQWFTGAQVGISIDTRDGSLNPSQGMSWSSSVETNIGVYNSTDTFIKLKSDLRVYSSPSLAPRITVAMRTGVEHVIGDFPFYASSTLGGKRNLRGYRSTRFAGRTAAWFNSDLRLELFDFAGYLAFGRGGPLGFFDVGRVWTDGESSSIWHTGVGGGVWAQLFDAAVLNGTVGFSEDDTTLSIGIGFQY